MASKRGTLSKRKITPELAQALDQGADLMARKRQRVMTAEILLLAFVTMPEVEAYSFLRQLSQQQGFNWDDFVRDIDRAAGDRRAVADQQFDVVTGGGQRTPLGQELLIVLDEGLTLAERQSSARCGSLQALAVMATIQIGTHWLLNRRGITERSIIQTVAAPPSAEPPASSSSVRGGAPLIYHRLELETKLVNLLSLKSERNIILVGPSGVGKRSLVLGVANLIAQGKGPFGISSVVELDEKQLLDGALTAVQRGIRQAQGGVLFVPDIDRFFGGIRADFSEEGVGNALQKAFLTEAPVIIGSASEDAYNKKLRGARVISEHSQILRVPPAQVEETAEILKTIKPRFEADYQLKVIDKSLEEAARLAGRYYTVKPLPGGAVDLLHRACAMVKTSRRTGAETGVEGDKQLDPDDVMVTASLLTGIPVNSMGADERNRYINMVSQLQKRIIGQEDAILALSRAVKMARVGLKDPKRPIGSFLFLGPTGVGKTELAKALAEFMFGTERALITLDMSEYMEASSVNRLIGSPPGYIGHDAGGQLTDTVKKQPYSVILFDEVEKAHPKVFDTLLQVMDEGRLTSGQGELVRFSECVILMTSNIGGHHLADVRLGHDFSADTELEEAAHQPAYHIDQIRTMLAEAFSAEELLALFGGSSLFSLDSNGASPSDKPDLIGQLLEQARQKAQFDGLLELAESYNKAKYEAHEPYFNWAVACQRAEAELKAHFRPEFLNRLDDIIYFHPLNETHLSKIMDLMLNQERALLKNQELDLAVSEPAKQWLLAQNEHPEWGARPLRRLIQRHIREQLAEYLLEQMPPAGTVMKVQRKGDQLRILQGKPGARAC